MERLVSQIKTGWDFFQRHRSKWGATLIAVGTYLATLSPEYAHHSQLALLVGGILTGGGALQSDSQHKAQQEWEREGVDRRQQVE
jgi:hypothetical protein